MSTAPYNPTELADYAAPFADQPASDFLRRTFPITLELPFVCPSCKEGCGHLFKSEAAPEGLCLGCELIREDAAIEQQQLEALKHWEEQLELQAMAEELVEA